MCIHQFLSIYKIFHLQPERPGSLILSELSQLPVELSLTPTHLFKVVWSLKPLFWPNTSLFSSFPTFTSIIWSSCPSWLAFTLGHLQRPSDLFSYPRLFQAHHTSWTRVLAPLSTIHPWHGMVKLGMFRGSSSWDLSTDTRRAPLPTKLRSKGCICLLDVVFAF